MQQELELFDFSLLA